MTGDSLYGLMRQKAALKARYERGDFDAEMQQQADALDRKINEALEQKRAKDAAL